MTDQRAARRATLVRLISRDTYRTLGALRRALALEGFDVSEVQVWRDLGHVGATRDVRWVLTALTQQPEGARR